MAYEKKIWRGLDDILEDSGLEYEELLELISDVARLINNNAINIKQVIRELDDIGEMGL